MSRTKSAGRLVIAALALAAATLTITRMSRGSPCPPCWMLRLTGELVEVRQDDQVLPPDASVFSHLPSVLEVEPNDYRVDSPNIKVSDSYDPTFAATFSVEGP
jgi:hypothetical protein